MVQKYCQLGGENNERLEIYFIIGNPGIGIVVGSNTYARGGEGRLRWHSQPELRDG